MHRRNAPIFMQAYAASNSLVNQKIPNLDALETRFRDYFSFAAKPVRSGTPEGIIRVIRDLESASDATEIIKLL